MAKKEAGPVEDPLVTGQALFFDKLMAANQAKFGRNIYVATEHESRLFGTPIPNNIAFQHVMDSDVLLHQVAVTLAGPKKSYKSSLGIYLISLFLINGWYARVVNSEGAAKWSQTKVTSMLGEELAKRLDVHHVVSVEDSQESINQLLDMADVTIKKVIKAQFGKDLKDYKAMVVPPMGVLLDSLTGSQTEAMNETINKSGSAPGKTFTDRAQLITQWLNTKVPRLTGIPITLICTNHEKDELDGKGGHYNPGGKAPGFQTSVDFRISKIKEISKANYEGALLKIRNNFSSIGRDNRTIEVEYIESYDEAGAQTAHFDWDGALITMIQQLAEESMYPGFSDKETRVIRIKEMDKPSVGKVYGCPELGISDDEGYDRNIKATDLGKLIHADPVLSEKVRTAARITRHQVWRPELTQAKELYVPSKDD